MRRNKARAFEIHFVSDEGTSAVNCIPSPPPSPKKKKKKKKVCPSALPSGRAMSFMPKKTDQKEKQPPGGSRKSSTRRPPPSLRPTATDHYHRRPLRPDPPGRGACPWYKYPSTIDKSRGARNQHAPYWHESPSLSRTPLSSCSEPSDMPTRASSSMYTLNTKGSRSTRTMFMMMCDERLSEHLRLLPHERFFLL